jgi:hypothetical protein
MEPTGAPVQSRPYHSRLLKVGGRTNGLEEVSRLPVMFEARSIGRCRGVMNGSMNPI